MSRRDDLSLSLTEALFRAQSAERAAPADLTEAPFTITISREVGALGASTAAEVGRRLGWPVFDRDVIDKVAERLGRPAHRVEAVDERPGSWFEDCVFGLLDGRRISSDAYLRHLIEVVRGLGVAGKCVIVGRGANFILAPETTLSVRLVAQPKDRIENVARKYGITAAQAEEWMRTTDRERVNFVERSFDRDPADPLHYDLVLNVSRLSVDEAADVIIQTLRRRESRGLGEKEQAPAEPAGKAPEAAPVA
jgi:transposase-like protein